MTRDAAGMPDFDSFEWEDDEAKDAHSLFEAAIQLDNLSLAAESSEEPSGDTVPPPTEEVPAPTTEGIPLETEDNIPRPPRRPGRYETDPFFISWLLMALSLGLSSVAVSYPIGRYALLWTILALAGGLIIGFREDVVLVKMSMQDLFWGIGWGLAVGIPLLFVGSGLLAEASAHIFPAMPDGAVFLIIVFVMAPTETVFFRYLVQGVQPVGLTALAASGWSILLFFPTMDVVEFPFVALIVGTFLVMLSGLYSYVRRRNGLAAAWLCQTLVSLGWLFVPRLLV